MIMSHAVIKNNYKEVLQSFGKDLQSAVDTALQKYLIDLITSKIAELRKKELIFEAKYKCDYKSFSQRISEDDEFVIYTEQNVNKMWEIELAEWEFSHKGIDDWTKKLQNILLIS
ncbi:Uncharacterized protein dnl_42260 [Desulfonema limicola]|uniref:Uncharacterized protein n=1 Tax=Desulfonema limicola TaxID=45656 RepID=A0A975BAR7_9BACT|nr:hypothetical protein [Desulfonema limicola]QTA81872.1 Uncharacterized protein dnl_42260 [Desulfonema limicola]